MPVMRCAYTLTLLCPLLAVASPAEAVAAASADILKVPEHDRKYVRYQTVYHVPAVERPTFLKVHSFQVNSLSRSPTLVKSEERLAAPTLLRLDVREYRWDPEVYDRLADADPYFHILLTGKEERLVEKEWPGGVWTQEGPDKGKHFAKGAFKYQVKEFVATKKTVATNPFWVDPAKYKVLAEQTQSRCPILRADWFLVQTGINEARVAGYYSFLGLKSRDDFHRLIGFNPKDGDAEFREVAAAVKLSGVARRPRQVFRRAARDFGYWFTKDVLFSGTGRKNALTALNGDLDHDAEEHYGFLLNGLYAYYLSDARGGQQDAAPPQVGPDTSATNVGDEIHVFKGCVVCHVEGLRPIKDFIRKNFRPPNVLAVADPNKTHEENKLKFERLQQLYLRPLERWFDRDVKDFAQTLQELNGPTWTTQKNASTYGQFWKKYAEDEVTLEQAALEVGDGCTSKTLSEAIRRYSSPVAKGGLGRLLPLNVQAFPGEPMLREHFEEAYPLIQAVVRGVVFEDAIKENKP